MNTPILLHNCTPYITRDESERFLAQYSSVGRPRTQFFSKNVRFLATLGVEKRQSPEPKSNSLRALRENFLFVILSEFLHFGHVLGHWESFKHVLSRFFCWDFFKNMLVFPQNPDLRLVLANFRSKIGILWSNFEVPDTPQSLRDHNRRVTRGLKRPETSWNRGVHGVDCLVHRGPSLITYP